MNKVNVIYKGNNTPTVSLPNSNSGADNFTTVSFESVRFSITSGEAECSEGIKTEVFIFTGNTIKQEKLKAMNKRMESWVRK